MKKILLAFGVIFFLASCQKDFKITQHADNNELVSSTGSSTSGKSGKISICHKTTSPTNPWVSIAISSEALADHLLHGDIVPDADGDGYTKVNPCGNGSQNDCNDNNPAINPGAAEVCATGIDENCNGQADENCPPSVTICNQVWMLKNLEVSKYRNGDDIPQATSNQEWISAGTNQTGAWCYYENNTANGPVYGKLYNWYALNDARGLAPSGWHIASDAEWTSLYNCLNGAAVAGGKLKETGTIHWNSPNTGATNSSGFTALPGGLRNFDGTFFYIGSFGVWWTASESSAAFAWSRGMYHISADAGRSGRPKSVGFSVRCTRD